jgi:hypothetical protein
MWTSSFTWLYFDHHWTRTLVDHDKHDDLMQSRKYFTTGEIVLTLWHTTKHS